MQQRLERFLKEENLTKAQFADSINVARAGISHIMAGRNMPSYEFIVNTMKAYPALNIEWLLTGNGEMYKNGNVTENKPIMDDLFSSSIVNKPETTERISPIKEAEHRAKARKVIVFYDDGTYEEFC